MSNKEHLWQIANRGDQVASLDAKDLWLKITGYFTWADNNPLEVPQTVKSGKQVGDTVYQDTPRPYSLTALCVYVGISKDYVNMVINGEDSEYKMVLEKAIDIIATQNIEWALVGTYNAVIAAKLNGINVAAEQTPSSPIINIGVIENGAPKLLRNE